MTKTKREYFTELKNLVADNDELTAFIDHELELLAKKNSAPKAPTAKQVKDEEYRAMILDAMAGADKMTIGDINKTVFAAAGITLSGQKVQALVRTLVQDGKVVRTEEKRKAYFALAE